MGSSPFQNSWCVEGELQAVATVLCLAPEDIRLQVRRFQRKRLEVLHRAGHNGSRVGVRRLRNILPERTVLCTDDKQKKKSNSIQVTGIFHWFNFPLGCRTFPGTGGAEQDVKLHKPRLRTNCRPISLQIT